MVNKKLDKLYMTMAQDMATISNGERAKVGAILVTENGVILTGVNGLPKPLGNVLEEPTYQFLSEFGKTPELIQTGLVTKNTVIHAELNCILKAAREGVSVINSTIYVTLSPCAHCASMLSSVGVKRVVYLNPYRDLSGIITLGTCGVEVEHYEELENEI